MSVRYANEGLLSFVVALKRVRQEWWIYQYKMEKGWCVMNNINATNRGPVVILIMPPRDTIMIPIVSGRKKTWLSDLGRVSYTWLLYQLWWFVQQLHVIILHSALVLYSYHSQTGSTCSSWQIINECKQHLIQYYVQSIQLIELVLYSKRFVWFIQIHEDTLQVTVCQSDYSDSLYIMYQSSRPRRINKAPPIHP